MSEINWEMLEMLVSIEKENGKKQLIYPETRKKVMQRDKVCQICGRDKDLHIHHIYPQGKADELNLIVLCKFCHQVVHNLLYVTGKYQYVDVTRGFWGRYSGRW
jgi:5-methylcytosine-specific restriction endonuclease McrA